MNQNNINQLFNFLKFLKEPHEFSCLVWPAQWVKNFLNKSLKALLKPMNWCKTPSATINMTMLMKMRKRKFLNFHWPKSTPCFWKIWDLITLIWKTRPERSQNIITAATLSSTTRLHLPRPSDWLSNLPTSLTPYQLSIQTPFTSDATRKELTSCKLWLWAQTEPHTVMELTCSIFTSMTLTQTTLQKLIWQRQVMDKSDSIPTFTVAEKFVWVCWVLGEVVPCKIGIRRFLHYFKFSFQFNLSSCPKKSTLMNRDSNTNKERLKEKRRTKPMQISSDMEMSSSQCFKTLRTHQKDSNTSLKDISTLRKTRSWSKQRNGWNTQKKEKHHTQDWWVITITTGATNLRSPKQNTKPCSKRL